MLELNYQIQQKSFSKDEIQNILSIFGSFDFQKLEQKMSLKDLQIELSTLLSPENRGEESLYDFQMLQFLDESLLNLKKVSFDKNKILPLIYSHLEFLSSVTNLLSGMESYSLEEMYNFIITGDEMYEKLKFFHTLRQSRTDYSKHGYCLMFLEYIRSEKKMNLPPVEQKIFQSLLLDTLWANFGSLPIDGRSLLCTQYFLFSILHGVPIQDNLKQYFYSTTTNFEFVANSATIFSSIGKNTELVFLNQKTKETKLLTKCIQDLKKQISDQPYSKDILGDVVLKMYSEINETYRKALIEAFDIIIQIENSSIVEKNVGGELDASDDLNTDMVQLVRWFSNRSDWVKISDYFKQSQTVVPKDFYFDKIRKSFDFSVPDDVDTLSSFSSTLRENGVIKVDLFTFDENTDQFVWNKNLY